MAIQYLLVLDLKTLPEPSEIGGFKLRDWIVNYSILLYLLALYSGRVNLNPTHHHSLPNARSIQFQVYRNSRNKYIQIDEITEPLTLTTTIDLIIPQIDGPAFGDHVSALEERCGYS